VINIISFEPRHAEAFRLLNEAWLIRFFELEEKDRRVLGNPQAEIIDKGGTIFIAENETGTAVGCVSMMLLEDGGYELAKMAVDEKTQGLGVGRKLMAHCIAFARTQNAPRIYIESNASLKPAITLYEKSGFIHLPARPTPYLRANVWMELNLRTP
jgi:putative acetyltransferase